MPTDKPRVTFTVSQETLQKINDFRFLNKSKNQTQAILSLIEKGLDGCETIKKSSPYSSEAIQLARDYDTLDGHGRRTVRIVANEELSRIDAERKAGQTRAAAAPEPVIYVTKWFYQPMSAGGAMDADAAAPESLYLTKEPPRGTSYVAPVRGDSMEPTFRDGDKLFISAQDRIRPGQIGVFLMDGKQWVKELGDGILISHNPAYPPRPFAGDVRCQGLVLGVCDKSYFN